MPTSEVYKSSGLPMAKTAKLGANVKKEGLRDKINASWNNKEEFELDERTRYAKETGKDYTTEILQKMGKEPQKVLLQKSVQTFARLVE